MEMVYVKSVLAGMAVLLVAFILSVFAYAWVVVLPKARATGMAAGLDVRAVLTRPFFWLIAILAFGIGFYWEFRRATA
jgi:hypothetical protein